MHGENSKIKVARWKNKSKAPTQSQNIIDSWAARGLLPSIYTNIYIPIWKWVGDQDGAQGRAHRITDWVSKLPNPTPLNCWPLAPPETNFNPSCHLNKAAYNTCGEFYKSLFRFISLSGVVSESILWYRKHLWGFSAAFCQVPACEMRLTINIMIYFICCLFKAAPWTHP